MGGVADGAGTGGTTVALAVRRREDTEYTGRLRDRRFAIDSICSGRRRLLVIGAQAR